MSRTRRVLAMSAAAAVGAFALAGVAASTASAATITSGTATFTVSQSYLEQLASKQIFIEPTGAQSVTYDSSAHTLNVVFTATGGDASLSSFAGSVDYSGGFTVFDCATGQQVQLSSQVFSLILQHISEAPTGGNPTNILDTTGARTAVNNGTSQTFTASKLEIDSAGASYLDNALGTTAFNAGDLVGSFATTWSY